jgi:hypothetical protein
MNSIARSRVVAAFTLLGATLVISACTGSDEDVRETFCKNLAIAQLKAAPDVEWQDSEQQIKHPEYAIITVRVKGDGRTSCWFEYDALEETAGSHVDPLSAYSTLPYQVSVNGKVLSERATLDAVNAEQIRQGKAAVEALRKAAYR